MARRISEELARAIREQAKIVRPELVYADNVIVGPRLRRVDPAVVETLAQSIAEIGLQVPISVRLEEQPDRQCLFLVAGAHRLAAVKKLGWENVPAVFIEADCIDVRRWEIAENLHRAELTVLERAEHVTEWLRLTEKKQQEDKPAQVAPVSVRGRTEGRGNTGGINAAVRELGIERTEAQRSVTIAEALTPEAKSAAVEAHLDDNQSALLAVAKTPAERQVAKIEELAQQRRGAAEPAPDPRKAAAGELAGHLVPRFSREEWPRLLKLITTLKCRLLVEELVRLGVTGSEPAFGSGLGVERDQPLSEALLRPTKGKKS